MDVTGDYEGHVELKQIRLPNENLLTFFNKHFNLLLFQGYGLDAEVGHVRTDLVTHVQESVYYYIEFSMIDLYVVGHG